MGTGQGRFDVSQLTVFKYPLRSPNAKSIVIELAPDGNGASSGTVAVFLGEAISGAPPWFSVGSGTVRVYPSPESDFVSIVPSTGARGICTVSLSQENLGVGIYAFDALTGGATGAVTTTLVATTELTQILAPNPIRIGFTIYNNDGNNQAYVTLAAASTFSGFIPPYNTYQPPYPWKGEVSVQTFGGTAELITTEFT